MTLNTTQNIQLEILTPVHIGTNQDKTWHKDMDFFYQNGKVYVVHQEDLFKAMLEKPNGKQEINSFSAKLASGKLKELRTYIFQHFDIEKIAYLSFDYPKEPTNEIKPLLRTGLGKPILAGSSLKGSIRTAILTYLIKNDKSNFASQEHNLGRRRGNKMFYSDSTLQRHYLGKDPTHDLLRMLQVGDFELNTNKTLLYKTQTLNLYGNSWNIKQSVSNFLECAGKQTSLGKINIPEKQLKNNEHKGILKHTNLLNFKKLFEIINKHTSDLILDELDFWKEEIEEADVHEMVYDYKEELESLVSQINSLDKEKSCILRVGAGSGWDFMTGAWAKDEKILSDKAWDNLKYQLRHPKYFDMPFPKSRKALEKELALPLGFVKLSLIN